MEEKTVAIRAFVSDKLRNDFKAACAKAGITMSDVLAEFIQEYVDKAESSSPTKDKGAA